MRPKSIAQFEMVYWAVIVLGLVTTAMSWDDMMASVQVQQMIARIGMAMVYGPIVVGILLQLFFWYFIARRGSLAVKWVFVVLTALGIAWSAFGLATHGAATVALAVASVALLILQVIAIVLVFRPDTREWFGETAEPEA